MIKLVRIKENPVLSPDTANLWESQASFNGCVIKDNGVFRLLYRGLSAPKSHYGVSMELSTIGCAKSPDGLQFNKEERVQLIKPEHEWELWGCEDPRVTKLNDKFYIFYTALSTFPFSAAGIKIGLAVTHDFQKIEEKHPVTTFNSKAMALFPEKINGKMAAILTANTDLPPSEIGIAFFDKEEEIWSKEYWQNWYSNLEDHLVLLTRNDNDQVEVGAPPIKTEYGWLIIYSYIHNYRSSVGQKTFAVEAVLLDLTDPSLVIGALNEPLLIPEEKYELYGNVPNIVFPTGALTEKDELRVYYGAADRTTCLATCSFPDLLKELHPKKNAPFGTKTKMVKLKRFEENPIIKPDPANPWEARATFNPACVYENGKVHLVYRAMSQDYISVIGYAQSDDGFHISERLSHPVYVPTEDFERKIKPGNSGCEDPRLTKIDDKYYMCYTAYNGVMPPRVALTSILAADFLGKRWNWSKPILISPPGIDDKDACILPKKINDKFVIFHRFESSIWIDIVEDLSLTEEKYLSGSILIKPRPDKWDNGRIGIGPVPVETKEGWLLIYHGRTAMTNIYMVGAVLLSLADPRKVIAQLDEPIFEPLRAYEKIGEVDNVVFPCGSVTLGENLFVYYGAADKVIGVATINLEMLVDCLLGL